MRKITLLFLICLLAGTAFSVAPDNARAEPQQDTATPTVTQMAYPPPPTNTSSPPSEPTKPVANTPTVEPVEFFHHLLADLGALNLPLSLFLEMEFNAVDDLLDDIDADRSLFTRLLQSVKDLEAVEGFSPAVLFDHRREGLLGPLARRKPFMAPEAFPPATDGLLFLALAGIDHFAFRMITEGAFHGLSKVI